jgi:hypothetical protein
MATDKLFLGNIPHELDEADVLHELRAYSIRPQWVDLHWRFSGVAQIHQVVEVRVFVFRMFPWALHLGCILATLEALRRVLGHNQIWVRGVGKGCTGNALSLLEFWSVCLEEVGY